MADPNLDKLERQYEQAKARLQSARARKAEKDRKLDARRKIILGGALIEKASRDPEATDLLMSLVAGLARVQDRKAFENWTPPVPEAGKDACGGAEARSETGAGPVSLTGDAPDDAPDNARMERQP